MGLEPVQSSHLPQYEKRNLMLDEVFFCFASITDYSSNKSAGSPAEYDIHDKLCIVLFSEILLDIETKSW